MTMISRREWIAGALGAGSAAAQGTGREGVDRRLFPLGMHLGF
jgi:hypothetical protein